MISLRAPRARTKRPQGLILHEGPSLIDGKPIVVIATGFQRRSANPKTGNMVQTWILRSDINPFAAIQNGQDSSVCGDCPLRGIIERSQGKHSRVNRRRACYVSVHQAPLAVFQAYQRGRYERFEKNEHLQLFRDRMLRIGSYGDPCAVPYSIWSTTAKVASGRTGYTHQWRIGRFWRFRRLVMASVESLPQAEEAQARGWRTFRTATLGEQPALGEFSCPASAEQGDRLTCEQCGACNGANGNQRRASVVIQAHGSPATLGSYQRMLDENLTPQRKRTLRKARNRYGRKRLLPNCGYS